MKAYTDLEQSKKLSEILPIESADMYYHPYPNDEDWYDIPNFGEADLKFNQLPCWSLAALLELLPNGSQVNKSSNGRYFCSGVLYDNPIDACVNEIEVLTDTGNLKYNKEE